MVSAVSAAVSRSLARPRPAAASPRSAGRTKFFQVPDLDDKYAAKITEAKAWPAFIGICRLVDQQAFRGTAPRRRGEKPQRWKERNEEVRRAAKEEKVIAVGLHAIARTMGLNISTVRRQVNRLHKLGVIVCHRRGLNRVADPATGKITENRIGRTPAALIYLTVTPDQLRPATKEEARLRVAECAPSETVGGAECAPQRRDDRAHNAPPSTDLPQTSQETPTATTTAEAPDRPHEDGHGLQANEDTGLTAGEAGRHTPAGAGGLPAAVLGEGSIVTVDPSRKGLTVTEATRIPAGDTASRPSTSTGGRPRPLRLVAPPDDRTSTRSPTSSRSTRSPDAGRDAEGAAPPAPWPAEDEAKFRRAREAYERQRAEDEARNPPVDRRAARQAAAEAGLIDAVAALPASSVAACRRLGRQIEAEDAPEPDEAAKAEAAALQALVDRKRAEERGVSRKAAKATKDAFREAYRAETAST